MRDRKKVCLVIGHTKKSPGAINKNTGISEFEFNDDLSKRIEKKAKGSNKVQIQRVYRDLYLQLPNKINRLNPDYIISLHCNALNRKTSGIEILYYHKSTRSKKMAKILLKHLVGCLKLKNKGVKKRYIRKELPSGMLPYKTRGAYLLKHTKAPCVIAESFFIDNSNDLKIAQNKIDELALAYTTAIKEILEVKC